MSRLAFESRRPPWEAFTGLDEVLSDIAELADQRLAWQNGFSV